MARPVLRRGRRDVELVVDDSDPSPDQPTPGLWWPLAAAGGGVVAPLATALVVVGLVVLGWTATPDIGLGAVLESALRLWLLSWFSGATVAGIHITLAPLTLTAVNAIVSSGVAGFAATMARRAEDRELDQHQRRRIALRAAGLFTGVQALVVLVTSFAVGEAGEPARALLGALLVGGLAAGVGAARAAEWHPLLDLPLWARAVPRAMAVAIASSIAVGAVVLGVQLIRRRTVVEGLHQALQAGTAGGLLVIVLEVMWLPNVVLWCTAWSLGAGFSVGEQTMVTPAANEVGMLPGLPLLGAVPSSGSGPGGTLAWLCSGLIAGVLAGLVVLRARPRARFDETALVGGLTGLLSGVAVTVLALLSRGDLGVDRLVGLGPRPVHLLVMSTTLMGLAGLVTGLLVGVLRPPGAEAEDTVGEDADLARVEQ